MVKLKKTFLFIISLFVPGSGHIIIGMPRLGLIFLTIAICAEILFTVILYPGMSSFEDLALLLFLGFITFAISLLAAVRAIIDMNRKKIENFKQSNVVIGICCVLVISIAMNSLPSQFHQDSKNLHGYRIVSGSMEPTIHIGDFLLASSHNDVNLRGELILYDFRGGKAVKRIVGLPGELVEYENDTLRIDGKQIVDPWKFFSEQSAEERADYLLSASTFFDSVRLGENEYYILGDNRYNSYDSRHHGPLEASDIKGKPFLIYWPPSRWRNLN